MTAPRDISPGRPGPTGSPAAASEGWQGQDALTFEGLFDLTEIQQLQDEFADATGVASLIIRPDGTPITTPSNFCRLCEIIRETELGRRNCLRSDAVLGVAGGWGPTLRACMSGGLLDAGAGIVVAGQHVASWMIGQVRDESQDEEEIRAYARTIGADEERAVEAFREVPAMSRERFGKIARALFGFASKLSTFAYQNRQYRRAQEEIVRLKDVYAALSLTNQAIVRISGREELFDRVCRIAIRHGHFRLAWVGLIDPSSRTLLPVARAGDGVGYLDGLEISTDPASPLSAGPSGQSALSGLHRVENDLFAAPGMAPWHDRMARYGFRAVAAFPLLTQGSTIGVITLYADRVGYFAEDIIALLDEMAADISAALDRLRTEAAHRQLQTESKAARERIDFLAHYDPVTRLPNRILGKDRMERAMLGVDRGGGRAALMLIDIDHFKQVNDTLGQAAGDALLQGLAERIGACIRGTDTLGRQGSDEFLVCLASATDPDSINRVAADILEKTIPPFRLEGEEVSITVSIGIAVYPGDGADFDRLLSQAGAAMRQAKEAGRNTYRFSAERMNAEADDYLALLHGMRRGLDRNEFTLHYQPQFTTRERRLVGFEALVRWHHPRLGLLPPGRFIAIAEESGLIVEIGQWVLLEACRQAAAWQGSGRGRLTVAVNLSAVQFKRGGLLEAVTRALAESRLDPRCLELELTESILIKDTANVLSTVKALKAMGVQLSIDDFGTGYSSLAYLRRLDLDKLKIDQSFVRGLAADSQDRTIVKAIVQMAHGLGLRTIAEGVEDAAILEAVAEQGCDEVQGYHLGRPMPLEEVARLLAAEG